MKNEGPFWISNLSKSSCKKLLKRLLELDMNSWNKIRNKNFNKVLKYDEGNKKFKKLLYQLIRN